MMKAKRGNVQTSSVRTCGVYGDTGCVEVGDCVNSDGDFTAVGVSLKWAGDKTKWWTCGSHAVKRSDLHQGQNDKRNELLEGHTQRP